MPADAVAAGSPPGAGLVAAAAKDKRDLTVMSRNLYLGADIALTLEATNSTELLISVATLYSVVQFTGFPTRADAIAAEIDAADADIVGRARTRPRRLVGLLRAGGRGHRP